MLRTLGVATAIALLVAGCGSSPRERALTGAGLGAAGGAAVGAVTDVGVTDGALLGGAAGAIIGAVTNENQIDLGEPLWRKRY